MNFQMFKLDLEKAEEPEIKLPTSTGSSKEQQSTRKASTFPLLTTPKPFTVWIVTNCGKFSSSVAQLCLTLCDPMDCSTSSLPTIANFQSLLKLMSIESVMPSSHLILCTPLLLLPPIPPSIRVFSNESALCMRWPNYWSFSFSISSSNEHPGLISFRMDWLDLLAVQGTLKSLLQHHSLKSIN